VDLKNFVARVRPSFSFLFADKALGYVFNRPRRPARPTRRFAIITDAATRTKGWGAIAIDRESATTRITSGTFDGEAHINVYEMLAIAQAVEAFADKKWEGHIVEAWTDSNVVLAILTKGTTRSWPLNLALRKVSTALRKWNMELTVRYVPSGSNTADPPSRQRTDFTSDQIDFLHFVERGGVR
jgi:ribonuclease HI